MINHTQRRGGRILWWIGGVFSLLVTAFFLQLYWPSPPIIVSKQTTFITAPLAPDELPDYTRYILDRSREGVTPENNAAVLLWRVIWPGELEREHLHLIAKEMGFDEIPSGEESLISLHHSDTRSRLNEWFAEIDKTAQRTEGNPNEGLDDAIDRANVNENIGFYAEVDELLEQVQKRPWTSERVAPLAEWIAENERPLNLAIEASKRPRYCSPSPSVLGDSSELFFGWLLPDLPNVREIARSLTARAMWELGENRLSDAWLNILAVHRLSRLVQQDPTLVGQLIGIAFQGMATEATIALLQNDQISSEQARQIHLYLATLPEWSSMAETVNQYERLGFLDLVVSMSRDMDSALEAISIEPGSSIRESIARTNIDWNLVLRDGNEWYDRLVAAMSLPTREQRQLAISKWESDMDDYVYDELGELGLWAIIIPRHRSKLMGKILLGLMLPAISLTSTIEDRANAQLEMLRLAAALAVYRAEHGRYPESLDKLVPDIVKQLPLDLYSGKPFIYKPDAEGSGYCLYSVFENGEDDGGNDYGGEIVDGQWVDDPESVEFDYDKTDLVIRVPVPPLSIPSVQSPRQD